MPLTRTTQTILGGLLLLAFTTTPLWAQDSYNTQQPSPDSYGSYPPSAGAPGEESEVITNVVPGYGREAYPDVMPGQASGYGVEAGPTGMDLYRQYPHPGPQWAATHAYPNYDYPDNLYGIWFRSQAWGLTQRERCGVPDPWRPRGFGNLFARPSTPHRMDYHRRVLIDPHTGYGPSYFVRQPDPRCCARNVDGYKQWVKTNRYDSDLKERLNEGTQVRIR
ncbi:MAG: hypothetical protein KDA84_19070 [Planctomycetaceae bacterium]|nr:hypothetical protein [Planctomycetaceae bacterium]